MYAGMPNGRVLIEHTDCRLGKDADSMEEGIMHTRYDLKGDV